MGGAHAPLPGYGCRRAKGGFNGAKKLNAWRGPGNDRVAGGRSSRGKAWWWCQASPIVGIAAHGTSCGCIVDQPSLRHTPVREIADEPIARDRRRLAQA